MCGICGIVSNVETRGFSVKEMNAKLFHRGPDMEGYFSDEYCTLAMRRLSIIDLTTGNQPVYSNSRNSLIFFNGEIYNYKDLRGELENKGIRFYTESDTEVIVNAYEYWGNDFISHLKGMFAFCIYDIRRKRWLLARDRFGEKPLYYFFSSGYLSFSSEIGSLLTDPRVPRRINKNAIPYYLTLSYVPEPDTLLEGVKMLPPGHFMILSDSKLSIDKYFEPTHNIDHSIRTLSDASDLIVPVWEQSVRRQMISDVPLGAFLSGGIDSSTVVATMQKFSSTPVKTFTVKFAEATYDESYIAKEVAEKLGTDHHEVYIPNAGFTEDLFWELIDKTGIPFPDSSAIPSYLITKEIRKHVKVALSGDGGDELFGGYNLFHWYQEIVKLSRLPESVRNISSVFVNVAQYLPFTKRFSLIRQMKKALALTKLSASELPIFLHALFTVDDIEGLFPGSLIDFSEAAQYPASFEEWSPLRKIMYFRLKHNLPLDMLTKVDRMSMANSLEVRAPFLDADLFEISSKLPDKFLMSGKTGKVVIREMMKDQLPASVFSHPKSGFSIPLHKYQNKEFKALVQELLLNGSELGPIMDRKALHRIVKQGLSISSDNSKTSVYKASHQLWALLQLSGWIKYYKISL